MIFFFLCLIWLGVFWLVGWGLFGWVFFVEISAEMVQEKENASRGCFSNWRLELKTSGGGTGHGKFKGFGRISFLET